MTWTIYAVALGLGVSASSFSGVWHLVDVKSVVCPNAPGYTLINISEPTDGLNKPHIFTFFRTSTAAVDVQFTATGSGGQLITTQGVTLQATSRRLQELQPPRQLSSRRRSGGGGFSSLRRRAPSPPPSSYSSPRRRAPSSYTSPRRRAAPAASGARRRTYGYDNKVHNNPSNPGAGNYGYTTPAAASSNFGGRLPTSTPYGYTGANAYSGSMGNGAKIAMAAGGGLLAGYLGSQLLSHTWTGYSREQMLNMPCQSGSWSGLCSTCVTMHGAQKCSVLLSPKINATRDDLLNTGFIPSSYTWPIIVNITKLSGVDFDPSKICGNNASMQQIFLTLTTLGELGQDGSSSGSSSSMSMWGSLIAIVAVCGCCCCCGAVAFRSMSKGSSYGGYGSSSESDWSDDHGSYPGAPGYGYPGGPGYGYPGAQAQHNPYQTQMVQPQAAHNPYWQSGAVAGAGIAQGVVLHGSPVGQSVHSTRSVGGFMDTAAPTGRSWNDLCQPHDVAMDSALMIDGPWGECLAWAVVYERQNPGWQQEPRYAAEGPAGQVIAAIEAKAAGGPYAQVALQGAENLEQACQRALEAGLPVPRIGRIIR